MVRSITFILLLPTLRPHVREYIYSFSIFIFSQCVNFVWTNQTSLGMNERQEIEPKYTQSESKVIASAAQMREANPKQLQMYTIQNDFTRTMYASGQWFNDHPECLLRDADGLLVNHTQSNQAVPECTAGVNNDTCYVYGFNTQCGREAWVKVRHAHVKYYAFVFIASYDLLSQFAVDTVTQGDLDGVFIDGSPPKFAISEIFL